MRWPWQRTSDAKEIRARAEAEERRTKRMTPVFEKLAAEYLANVPAEEFADRCRRAFQRRPT